MNPVIIVDEQESVFKDRTVKIVKEELYKDIDSLTYKYTEGKDLPAPLANAIASDTSERMDGHIIARHVEYRDARLRTIMSFALKDDVVIPSADDVMELDPNIMYVFSLPDSFKDSMVQALTNLIHRYLVWGTLFDWYGPTLGVDQAAQVEKSIDMLESQILNLLRTPSLAKRPLQPFGPAHNKIKW